VRHSFRIEVARAGYWRRYRRLRKCSSDVLRELFNIYVAENVVVAELAIRGTHKGELTFASGNVAPTCKAIDVPSCDVFHLKRGKVISFNCYNAASVMQQQLSLASS
jgi:SnoaL-like polyketide cyclase